MGAKRGTGGASSATGYLTARGGRFSRWREGRGGEKMRKRITLLLMLMASTLLVASGVAWAVTKTCPPTPKKCLGTSGADVLKSTSRNNWMYGKGGNDTYTHFVRGNSGNDGIIDSGGKDHLLLLNYTQSEVRLFYSDINK